jgi:hypothetical protein
VGKHACCKLLTALFSDAACNTCKCSLPCSPLLLLPLLLLFLLLLSPHPCSIKAQDEPYETPMQPITIMRNALSPLLLLTTPAAAAAAAAAAAVTMCSIKAQDEPYETPMQPITIMRNALGREEGGSGVPLNRDAYEASTAYWANHAPIVAGEEPSGE